MQERTMGMAVILAIIGIFAILVNAQFDGNQTSAGNLTISNYTPVTSTISLPSVNSTSTIQFNTTQTNSSFNVSAVNQTLNSTSLNTSANNTWNTNSTVIINTSIVGGSSGTAVSSTTSFNATNATANQTPVLNATGLNETNSTLANVTPTVFNVSISGSAIAMTSGDQYQLNVAPQGGVAPYTYTWFEVVPNTSQSVSLPGCVGLLNSTTCSPNTATLNATGEYAIYVVGQSSDGQIAESAPVSVLVYPNLNNTI